MFNARICQIAMCTRDIPATTRIYAEALGFASAGGRPLWGERIARIQGLPSGAATALSVWWLVGRQDFMQLELFNHTTPVQRPRPVGWRPNELGWVRWGTVVEDFDATLTRLAELGVAPITEPIRSGGTRRACFREPGAEVIVEVIEDSADSKWGQRARFYNLSPAVHYVAVSVRDLAATSELFRSVGLTDVASDFLHDAGDEAMWGLPGAARSSAVLTDGDIYLELVQYAESSAPADDHLLSDQGFMNIALGFRERPDLVKAFDALIAAGCTTGNPMAEIAGGTYLATPDGLSIELLVAPREVDAEFGFTPLAQLHRPLVWPQRLAPLP